MKNLIFSIDGIYFAVNKKYLEALFNGEIQILFDSNYYLRNALVYIFKAYDGLDGIAGMCHTIYYTKSFALLKSDYDVIPDGADAGYLITQKLPQSKIFKVTQERIPWLKVISINDLILQL